MYKIIQCRVAGGCSAIYEAIRSLLVMAATLLIGFSSVASVQAAEVRLDLFGDVTTVADPLIGGGTTIGITTDDVLEGYLIYEDTTAQVQGGFRHYQLTELLIRVPDTTQASGTFLLAPALNTATRVVFDNVTDEFIGLHLPVNPGPLNAFGLSDVDFRAVSLTLGNEFAFRRTTPIVEGVWTVEDPEEVMVPIPSAAIAALAMLLLIFRNRRFAKS